MMIIVIGLILLNFIGFETSISFIIICLVLLGFGFALFSSPNTNAIMSSVEKRNYGVASATLSTMRITGQMLSMGIVMLVFSVYIGKSQIVERVYPQFMTSIKIAFTVFAIMCFVGIFASLVRGKIRN